MKKRILLISLLLAMSFAGGWFSNSRDRTHREVPMVEAWPQWGTTCSILATESEKERFELAVRSLDVYGSDLNAMALGAQKFLAHGIFRREDDHLLRVCPPEGLYRNVADIMTRHEMWPKRINKFHLQLATWIGEARPEIVESIAVVAFAEHPQQDESLANKDMRPLARTVLAGFGREIAHFGETAYPLIHAENALGTGAAQVAAAAGYPDALPRISTMMWEILSALPKDEPIPWHQRNRLYELAYAISLAGEAGQDHIGPILEIMGRRVESWAPPFGMVDLRPKRMCALLRGLSTDKPERIEDYPYCLDDKVPLES